jgi:hypothetical protein
MCDMTLPIAPIAYSDNAEKCADCGRKLREVFIAGQAPSGNRPRLRRRITFALNLNAAPSLKPPPTAANPWFGRAVCSACKPTRDWSGDKARWRSFPCQNCGRKVHYLIGREYRYCTYRCALAVWTRQATERRSRDRAEHRHKRLVCAVCGGTFTAARSDARYCSATCRQRAHRKAAAALERSGRHPP